MAYVLGLMPNSMAKQKISACFCKDLEKERFETAAGVSAKIMIKIFIFIGTNFLMLVSMHLLVLTLGISTLRERLLLSSTFFVAQIVFTEMLLGFLGILYLPVLLALNLLIVLYCLAYSWQRNGRALKFKLVMECRTWAQSIPIIMRGWENRALWILAGFVTFWFILSACFLPPRGGADDIFYHLPPVYEFIIKHKIYLLPIYQIKYCFAYPLNAELLFMWPAIFFHSQQWVDFVQYVVAWGGVLVVYALSKLFGNTTRTASFLALLFLFAPVVLHQAESNYIDICTNVFFLITVYFSLQFALTQRVIYLYAAAIAGGLLVGMKYFMVAFWALTLCWILPELWRKNKEHFIRYLFIVFILGGLWYLRNLIVLGNPIYPINIFQKNFGVFFTGNAHINFFRDSSEIFRKIFLLSVGDLGLGTYDGGFGLVFWGIAFPSWGFVFIRSTFEYFLEKKKRPFLLFWALVPLGFALLLIIPIRELGWSVRFTLFIVAIGLLALGEILKLFSWNRAILAYIRSYGILGAVLSVTLLSVSVFPNYRLYSVFRDRALGRRPSEFKYYKDSSWYLPYMRFIAEPLDALSKGKEGLNCYLAADSTSFWVTNIYGTRFQNRVWNLEPQPQEKPDVYIHQSFESPEVSYIGPVISLGDIVQDPDYLLITQTPFTYLFISREALQKDHRLEYLLQYYEETFPEILRLTKDAEKILSENYPLIVSHNIGYGFRYWSLRKKIRNEVFWIPQEFSKTITGQKELHEFYSIGFPLEGFLAKKLGGFFLKGKEIPLYKNWK